MTLVFLSLLALWVTLTHWLHPWVDGPLCEATARVSAALLRWSGTDATAEGRIVSSEICSLEIIGECTGVHPAALFAAAVLAFPSTIRARLAGCAAGITALLVVNQVRVIGVCHVQSRMPDAVDFAHVVIGQALMTAAVVVLFLVWVETLGAAADGG